MGTSYRTREVRPLLLRRCQGRRYTLSLCRLHNNSSNLYLPVAGTSSRGSLNILSLDWRRWTL
ncbi:uncharacterized protein BJ212DRAFT_1311756, partial [Suillus subaureus]